MGVSRVVSWRACTAGSLPLSTGEINLLNLNERPNSNDTNDFIKVTHRSDGIIS